MSAKVEIKRGPDIRYSMIAYGLSLFVEPLILDVRFTVIRWADLVFSSSISVLLGTALGVYLALIPIEAVRSWKNSEAIPRVFWTLTVIWVSVIIALFLILPVHFEIGLLTGFGVNTLAQSILLARRLGYIENLKRKRPS